MMIQYGNKELLCGNIPAPTTDTWTLTSWFANLTNFHWGPRFVLPVLIYTRIGR